MDSLASKKVNHFLEDIQFQSSEKFEILTALRPLVKGSNPEIYEDIKYGGLVYLYSGELLGGIFVYKNHLSIEFGKGSELADPDGILEGQGKYRRHIKIASINEIESKQVKHFVNLALANKN